MAHPEPSNLISLIWEFSTVRSRTSLSPQRGLASSTVIDGAVRRP